MGGTDFLQKGPWKDSNPCNWVLGRATQGCQSVASKFQRGGSPAARGKVQELTAVTGVASVGEEKDWDGASTANRDGRRRSEGRRRRSGGWRVGWRVGERWGSSWEAST
jgi:hypothetical protein